MLNLLLCAIAISSTNATLNIEHGGQSMGALFKEVSNQTNSTWRVAAEFDPIIVTIRLDDVPEAEFRDKLATTMDGRWKRLDDGWRIEPDPKKVAETRKKNFDRRVAAITELQKAARERIKQFESWSDERANSLIDTIRVHAENIAESRSVGTSVRALQGMLGEIPVAEIPYRVLEAVSAEEIAKMGDIRRIVYSTNPTVRQRAFPKGIVETLGVSLDRQKRFIEKMKSSIVPRGSAAGYIYALMNPVETSEVSFVRAAILIPGWRRDFVAVKVSGIDHRGKPIWEAEQGFQLAMSANEVPPEPYSGANETIPLERFTALFQKFAKPDNVDALPIDLVEKLEAPDVNEPIRVAIGVWLASWAAERKKNLIAIIPDAALGASLRSFSNDMPAKTRFSIMSTTAGVAWSAEENWLFGKPRDPDAALRQFTPRKAMGKFMKAVRDRPEIDDWIEFVGALEPASLEKALFVQYIGAYPDIEHLLLNEDWEALKLIHMLGPAQRLELAAGRSVPYSSFSLAARNWLEKALVNLEIKLAPTKFLKYTDFGYEFTGEHWTGEIEPTEWLSSVTESASLSLDSRSITGIFVTSGRWKEPVFFPASFIGSELASTEPQSRELLSRFNTFQAAKQSAFDFQITFNNGICGHWRKKIPRRASGSPVGSMDLLPQDVRDAIEKERQKHLKPPPGR